MTTETQTELEALRPHLAAVPDLVVERLRGARRILAVAHEHPDADTLGATLAVTCIGEVLGASVSPVCADTPPPLYGVLPGVEHLRAHPDPNVDYDLLVVSDCGTLERTGAVLVQHRDLLMRLPRITIDHHISNDASGDADWIDPAAAATCEMVALLAVKLGIPLDAGNGFLSRNLTAGLITDTATFAHPNTTPRTLLVAAALLAVGAPISALSTRFYRTKPVSQLRLFGRVLGKLQVAAGGRVIWSTITDEDLMVTGARPSESEGIIDVLAQADTADVAILFKEISGAVRISVRTKPGGVDATLLTALFGGGGHARAAGASVQLPLDAAVVAVIAEAERLASLISR